ncbi:MAG: PEP/pyruvate-binding domain-containing protein [Syntrophobacteraceae bacterium]
MDQRDPLPTGEIGQTAGSTEKWTGRLYRHLLFFLEAIGLRREEGADQSTQIARLRLYHTEFRKLLSANNSFLESLGDLEKKRLGREFFDRDFIKRRVVRGIADIHAMVESLNAISGDRYPLLRERLDDIGFTLTCAVDESCVLPDSPLVMDLNDVSVIDADLVGGKMANLGELRVKLDLPTPAGMVVTTEGYRLLIESGGLRSWIQDKHVELSSVEDAALLSATLREQILGTAAPAELEGAILAGWERFCPGGACQVAVRSSAVGEDSEFSFAGQFLSLLNVSKENLCGAYLRVLASLYSPEAVHYRKLHGIAGESAEMAVGFIAMVDAEASGVVFTKDPNEPDSGKMLVQAVRGLGLPLVDGRVSPEVVYVPRSCEPSGLVRIASMQGFRTGLARGDGVLEEALSPEELARPCISDDEALELARWALRLEGHFGGPQDIEWAVDRQRRLVILQSRPLRLPRGHAHTGTPVPGAALLLRGGETACPGAGAGPAVHMDADGDLDSFPQGAVLVARRSSPKLVRVMSKASAIVTDVGSTTGHMASLAREFRVPALLNTLVATRDLPPGKVITVDAGSGFVYEGEIPELLAARGADEGIEDGAREPMRTTSEYRLLEEVLEWFSPLNLTAPESADFSPAGCRTLHDIARFVHEKSYREMFMLGENVGDLRGAACQLDVALPVDLYVIDLGGGLKRQPKQRKVKPAQIASAPFAALVKGMLNEKIQRFGAKPMDVRGLFSIMMRHAVTSPEQEHSFSEPCYALVSDCYLNYTARVGYHFSVVDAYCSGIPNKNYISILFRGGAADYVRRNRRIRAIGGILKRYGFSVAITHDMATARLSKATKDETISQLEMIGSLFQFFRQMDAAMADEESVSKYRDAFLNGDYGLEGSSGRT